MADCAVEEGEEGGQDGESVDQKNEGGGRQVEEVEGLEKWQKSANHRNPTPQIRINRRALHIAYSLQPSLLKRPQQMVQESGLETRPKLQDLAANLIMATQAECFIRVRIRDIQRRCPSNSLK